MKVPTNIYLFVSNANAPTKLYDTADDDPADKKEKSFFLGDYSLFDAIKDINAVDDKKWGNLVKENAAYLANSKPKNVLVGTSGYTVASAIHTIFGLDNPYTKNNIVFAKRAGCTDLSSKLADGTTTDGSDYYAFVLGLPHAD